MCDRCAELDRRIGHLNRMVEQLRDPRTTDAANKMIEEMEAEKGKLHPEPEK
jgi:hypothetical protein